MEVRKEYVLTSNEYDYVRVYVGEDGDLCLSQSENYINVSKEDAKTFVNLLDEFVRAEMS